MKSYLIEDAVFTLFVLGLGTFSFLTLAGNDLGFVLIILGFGWLTSVLLNH